MTKPKSLGIKLSKSILTELNEYVAQSDIVEKNLEVSRSSRFPIWKIVIKKKIKIVPSFPFLPKSKDYLYRLACSNIFGRLNFHQRVMVLWDDGPEVLTY